MNGKLAVDSVFKNYYIYRELEIVVTTFTKTNQCYELH